MAEDLRRFVNRFAISAKRAGPIQRTMKWVRRRPAVAVALACVLIAVVAAAFFAYQAQVAERWRLSGTTSSPIAMIARIAGWPMILLGSDRTSVSACHCASSRRNRCSTLSIGGTSGGF
jgi:hypothetical protein